MNPVPPANFTFIEDEFQPGEYLIGLDKFTVSEFHITNILQRQLTSAEEYILGILSVFLIAILADIAQTLLMRTNDRHLHINGLLSAYMVHELSHFRNIWSHIKRSNSHPLHAQRALWTRRRACLSLLVLSTTFGLFAADVIAVLLTQPSKTFSDEHQYNLVAIQPIGTPKVGLSKLIRRLTGDRPCVSPIMIGSGQQRNFLISACTQYEIVEALSGDDDVSDEITVASWFHRGGSDHNITIGEARIGIRRRAELLLGAEEGGARWFLFRSQDDSNLSHAKYIHEVVFDGAIQWACDKIKTRTCEELREEIKIRHEIERREIKLWRGKEGDVMTEADGVKSIATIRMNAPYRAMNSGLRALVSSGAIIEVEDKGAYVRIADDSEEDGLVGLLSEDGRVAGVLLFGMILLGLATVMIFLRVVMKPVSLGYVALSGIQQRSGMEFVSTDHFDGVEDDEYEEYMEGLGAGGLGERSYSIWRRNHGQNHDGEAALDLHETNRNRGVGVGAARDIEDGPVGASHYSFER